MKVAVLVFPGTSCDGDCHKAVVQTIGQPVQYVRHTETDLSAYDCIIVPGGSSYGDALRGGALARYTPVVDALIAAAEQGKLILGIDNGFQLLLEAGLLPGTLMRNESLKFRCSAAALRVENNATAFTGQYGEGAEIQIPIAHGQGNYYCDDATLARLQAEKRIVFRYIGSNPNGSRDRIAGIINERGNVLGMMPHPERAVNALLGSEDGKLIFTSILSTWRENHGAAAIG